MAEIRDYVKIKTKKAEYEGRVMPRSELAAENHIVIKLKSGYNIGIDKNEIENIEKIKVEEVIPKKEKVAFNKDKPPISIVTTGGTITARVDYQTGGAFPVKDPTELLTNIPELKDIVNIKNIQNPFSMLSEDMTSHEWGKIAENVYKELKTDSRGVIVTHGTDTLHYTAAALSFMLENLNKPVAVVGAQRSSDRGSFDGNMNLICASHYCLSDIAEVSIVMHGSSDDDYCIANRGTKVRKMHSARRDAFRPVNELPLAKIWVDGKLEKVNPESRNRSENKLTLDNKMEDKVAMLLSYPGSKPEQIDYYIDEKFKGLILVGTGFGHVATQPIDKKLSWLPHIKKALNAGMFIGMTTQTLYGRTDPYVYSAGRLLYDLGVVYLGDMLPETAYVKLAWVLGHTNKEEEVKGQMLTNFAGEIQERIDPETFLF